MWTPKMKWKWLPFSSLQCWHMDFLPIFGNGVLEENVAGVQNYKSLIMPSQVLPLLYMLDIKMKGQSLWQSTAFIILLKLKNDWECDCCYMFFWWFKVSLMNVEAKQFLDGTIYILFIISLNLGAPWYSRLSWESWSSGGYKTKAAVETQSSFYFGRN